MYTGVLLFFQLKKNYLNIISQDDQKNNVMAGQHHVHIKWKKKHKGLEKEKGNMEVDKTLCKSVHSKEIEVRYNLYLHSNYDAEICTALGSAISIKKILSSRMSKLQNVMLQVIQNNVA